MIVIGSELFHNHSLFYCNASLANLTVPTVFDNCKLIQTRNVITFKNI